MPSKLKVSSASRGDLIPSTPTAVEPKVHPTSIAQVLAQYRSEEAALKNVPMPTSMFESMPWIEKYRPKVFADLILDPDIKKQLEIFLRDIPNQHLILTGDPGVGKTSAVKCLAKELLGEQLNEGYTELNSAEDRNAKSISALIPPFCKKIFPYNKSKVILLDEADNATDKCQSDLSDLIKQFGAKTKFVFTCNESHKIIEDIQSVCLIVHFKKMSEEQIIMYLERICKAENVKSDKAGLAMVSSIAEGDMRKAINCLQQTAVTFGKVTKTAVMSICKIPDPERIAKILDLCAKKELLNANLELENIIREGYCLQDITTSIINLLSADANLEDKRKYKLVDIASHTKVLLSIGIKTKLQMCAMLCKLIENYA
jgi:replication factor C subunit 2/4